MKVYFKDFKLLKKGYSNITTVDFEDTMLIAEDELDILNCFFEVGCDVTEWWDDATQEAKSYFHGGVSSSFVYQDTELIPAGDSSACVLDDTMVVGSCILLYLRFYGDSRHYGLVVVDKHDYHLVGFVSSYYGTISSPELARLILAVPEINWDL